MYKWTQRAPFVNRLYRRGGAGSRQINNSPHARHKAQSDMMEEPRSRECAPVPGVSRRHVWGSGEYPGKLMQSRNGILAFVSVCKFEVTRNILNDRYRIIPITDSVHFHHCKFYCVSSKNIEGLVDKGPKSHFGPKRVISGYTQWALY